MSFIIPETTVENFFFKFDSVLSCSWAKFCASHYTQSNVYFNAEMAQEHGLSLKYVMNDAAILRMLEVAGYAIVPEEFYESLKRDWHF
jgi:hypothetical protein